MIDEAATLLLERLSSAGVDAAWREFLSRYSPTIMHVIRRHEADDDRVAQCFNQVCAALSDDAFRRLRSFRPDGPARFSTWLMAVVANLYVDWRRKEQGRVRAPRSVARLPELEQRVYHCIYEQGMSRVQCVETLAQLHPGLTVPAVSEINARLFAMLTPQQRWQLSAHPRTPQRATCNGRSDEDDPAWQVAAPGPGPDELVEEWQDHGRLELALSSLPAGQRLLVRMRYEQGLTLAEIARLTGQSDPFRVNRQIQAALGTLSERMGLHKPPDRKTP